jgi:polyisoprenoid-binding protein YceI
MNKFLSLFALLAFAQISKAETFKVDPVHSSVGFEIRHLFTPVKGSFSEYSGTFSYDAKKVEASKVDFKIVTKSVNTGNPKRDEHLVSGDFFDAAKNPNISFKSKSVKSTGDKKMDVTGDMTLHGVTKPVTFNVQFLGEGPGMDGKQIASFRADTTVKRKDFGMSWNKPWDAKDKVYETVLGEDVKIELTIEAGKN